MDGVVVVDKPAGVTSHDVVALARRALRERRIGHTGTLDPLATGVLPLACGRATRLVRFLTASDKDYEAVIRFGVTTDSYDITGTATGGSGRHPDRAAIERALPALRGDYRQQPPPYSAKKVAGQRAYALARRSEAVVLEPVPVHVSRAELRECEGPDATVRITCSAGFYVRSFAHALGEMLGTGACLAALRRTRSGEFTLAHAVTAAELLTPGADPGDRLIPLDRLLPAMPGVVVTEEGCRDVAHGRDVPAAAMCGAIGAVPAAPPAAGARDGAGWYRVVDASGRLLALGTKTPGGVLHPSVVLI